MIKKHMHKKDRPGKMLQKCCSNLSNKEFEDICNYLNKLKTLSSLALSHGNLNLLSRAEVYNYILVIFDLLNDASFILEKLSNDKVSISDNCRCSKS